MARIEQFGHGARHEISAQMALDAAAEAEPIGNYHYDTFNEDPPRGAQVRVRADDYGRDPVEGELVELGPEKIGVRRWDPRASNIVVHFPRLGYDLRAIR
jgi:hypothetical protein